MKYELNRLYNDDCLEEMKSIPDKYFDLAIVDPPYGLGDKVVNSGGRFKRYENKNGNWDNDIPMQEKNRFHPTQKPVALYAWLLNNYAKEGDKILDTHVGSASSLIACHKLGFDYLGFELDEDYFNKASERLEKEKSQMSIFEYEMNLTKLTKEELQSQINLLIDSKEKVNESNN